MRVPRSSRGQIFVGLSATLVAGIAVVALAANPRGSSAPATATVLGAQIDRKPQTPVGKGRGSGKTFIVEGSTAGLFPGNTQPLRLTITNPHNFEILVTQLTVSVADAAPACPASALVVDDLAAPVRVAKKGKAQTSLRLAMTSDAPDACQGATFPLSYEGAAVKR